MDKVSSLPALNKCELSGFIHLTRGGSGTLSPPPPPQPHLKRLCFFRCYQEATLHIPTAGQEMQQELMVGRDFGQVITIISKPLNQVSFIY